jgi:hypothetical protein
MSSENKKIALRTFASFSLRPLRETIHLFKFHAKIAKDFAKAAKTMNTYFFC